MDLLTEASLNLKTFKFEDQEIPYIDGQTIGAALLNASVRWLRSAEDSSPRGLFCGIGTCWECRCVIDGRPNTRACMTFAEEGIEVRRQRGLE